MLLVEKSEGWIILPWWQMLWQKCRVVENRVSECRGLSLFKRKKTKWRIGVKLEKRAYLQLPLDGGASRQEFGEFWFQEHRFSASCKHRWLCGSNTSGPYLSRIANRHGVPWNKIAAALQRHSKDNAVQICEKQPQTSTKPIHFGNNRVSQRLWFRHGGWQRMILKKWISSYCSKFQANKKSNMYQMLDEGRYFNKQISCTAGGRKFRKKNTHIYIYI